MTPLSLGIFASAANVASTSFESIATTSITSNTASITFSSIPSTFTHLQIRYISRTTRTVAPNDSLFLRLNSDTGSNYARHYIQGDGSTASAYGQASTTFMFIANAQAAGGTASDVFGAGIIDILDYTNTNKYKTMRAISGVDGNGSGGVDLDSSLWLNTNAITSITLLPDAGQFVNRSTFALYGIKSA